MSLSRRVSVSYTPVSPSNSSSNLRSHILRTQESSEFLGLCSTLAKDLAHGEVFEVDVDISVDAACESLIEHAIPCLAVRASNSQKPALVGLFDCADVNAFLTLAATSHLLSDEDFDERASQILEAARSGTGSVPVQLCTDLSEKNPLVTLPLDATVLSLLEVFSRGTHRVLIDKVDGHADIVSDIGLLAWFMTKASTFPSITSTLEKPLPALGIGSRDVISCLSSDTVLASMKLMSEGGLSSLAVTDTEGGDLLSAAVHRGFQLVAPSQSKKILSMPLAQFITLIKAPGGSQDGADRYPVVKQVFSVSPNSTLSHVIQKLLATNTHRVFITDDPSEPSGPLQDNLRGVVSVVDVLSVFAHLAGISNVDPTRMQRQRRASSASSSSSRSASGSRVGRRSSMHSSRGASNVEREGRHLERKQ